MRTVSSTRLPAVNRKAAGPLFTPEAVTRFMADCNDALAVAEKARDWETVKDIMRLFHAVKRLSLERAA